VMKTSRITILLEKLIREFVICWAPRHNHSLHVPL
jgi:hypothetical protein